MYIVIAKFGINNTVYILLLGGSKTTPHRISINRTQAPQGEQAQAVVNAVLLSAYLAESEQNSITPFTHVKLILWPLVSTDFLPHIVHIPFLCAQSLQ